MATYGEILDELKKLATAAGPAIFRRVQLTAALLADRSWLNLAFDGDEAMAKESLAQDYFPEMGLARGGEEGMSLTDILAIYDALPLEEQWAAKKYRIQALRASLQAAKKVVERDAIASGKDMEQWWQQMDRLRQENERLRQQIEHLEMENARLLALIERQAQPA